MKLGNVNVDQKFFNKARIVELLGTMVVTLGPLRFSNALNMSIAHNINHNLDTKLTLILSISPR